MIESTSPLTGIRYTSDESEGDSAEIERFLARNASKKTVVVQGLGFVGSVMAIVCATAHGEEYAVIGVDVKSANSLWKIRSLNEGTFPLVADDPEIETCYRSAMNKGNFRATFDPIAYTFADIIVVDINLDVDKVTSSRGNLESFDVNLSTFKAAIETIGMHCKETVLVLVETTVPPGTCEKVVKPILENALASRGLSKEKFRLAHSYERVMPGPNYVDSIRNFPRVFSGIDEKSADAAEKFLKTIIDTDKCDISQLGNTNATEMAKVLENSYRAMNIAFIVEWTRFAEETGVNLYEVVRAIRKRPTHANIMLPGIGVGGYCLTKDPLLASWSRQKMFGIPQPLAVSERGVSINDKMPEYAFEFLVRQFGSLKGVPVLLLGVSYRGDVGDTRYSPVSLFFDCLVEAGADVNLHDPFVTYWTEKQVPVRSSLEDSLGLNPRIVVISTMHSLYRRASTTAALSSLTNAWIYDTLGLLTEDNIEEISRKNTVRVLGRGDLRD